jgi:hypothetical protein
LKKYKVKCINLMIEIQELRRKKRKWQTTENIFFGEV